MAYPDEYELLQLGPRHRLTRSRVALLGVGVLVAAGLIGWRVAGRSSGHPAAAPTSSTRTRPPPGSVADSAKPPRPIVAPTDAPAVEVDGKVFAIFGGALFTVKPGGTYTMDKANHDGPYQLIGDPARHRVWLITLTPGAFDVRWVDSRHPGGVQLGMSDPDRQLLGAALLDGALYVLTTDWIVYRTSVGRGGENSEPTEIRNGQGLVADPQRSRLLITSRWRGYPVVDAQAPSAPKPSATARLPFGTGQVVVVGGQIWAAGSGERGAVLARLDPGTLRVRRYSPLEPRLGPGARVVATGGQVLLVRGSSGGYGLWCVDARSGDVLESWPNAPGALAAGPDGASLLSAAGRPPQQLTGGRCLG